MSGETHNDARKLVELLDTVRFSRMPLQEEIEHLCTSARAILTLHTGLHCQDTRQRGFCCLGHAHRSRLRDGTGTNRICGRSDLLWLLPGGSREDRGEQKTSSFSHQQ